MIRKNYSAYSRSGNFNNFKEDLVMNKKLVKFGLGLIGFGGSVVTGWLIGMGTDKLANRLCNEGTSENEEESTTEEEEAE